MVGLKAKMLVDLMAGRLVDHSVWKWAVWRVGWMAETMADWRGKK